MKLVFTIKKYRTSIILFLVFETIAVWLWQATGKLFFLLNFSYIGIWVALGLLLFTEGWKYAREFTQFGVGSYMLVFLGLICRENLQIEGLWYYLLCGVVGAGTLHYAIAKDSRPVTIRERMVWICLLDNYDSRSIALQTEQSTKKEVGLHPIHHVRLVVGYRSFSYFGLIWLMPIRCLYSL